VSSPDRPLALPAAPPPGLAVDLRQDGTDVLLPVRVQARASRDAVEGVAAGRLRIRLTAPPVGGAANEACLAMLADLFDLAKSRLRVERGAASRDKLVRIAGATAEAVGARLARVAAG
jgi:uncharacterized protein (TIGR00251 family)